LHIHAENKITILTKDRNTMNKLPESILTKDQKKVYGQKKISKTETLTVFLRYDDQCKNGHNTFSITGEIRNSRHRIVACGCLHNDIQKCFPELQRFIKYHLVSSDGPLYYIENTMYWVEQNSLENVRSSSVWHDFPESYMQLDKNVLVDLLNDRLHDLMIEFKNAMVELGFIY
jgi:predicted transcriptional regulator YheO